MRKTMLVLAAIVAAAGTCQGAARTGTVVDRPAQALDFTQDMDVGAYGSFSMQAVYSDGTPGASTVAAGRKASATLTVADFLILQGRPSTATVTLQAGKNSTGTLTGARIEINGRRYVGGTDWQVGATSTATAANIAAAIHAFFEYNAHSSSNVVTVVAAATSALPNQWQIATTTPAALSINGSVLASTSAFSNGNNPGYLTLNYVTLAEKTHWTAATSSAATANSLSAAINADSSLSPLVTASTPSLGVVLVLADSYGNISYPISVSSPAALVPQYSALSGGATTAIDLGEDAVYRFSHGMSTGMAVLFSTGGSALGGLTNQATYYVVRAGSGSFKLSDTSTGAAAGIVLNLTSFTEGAQHTFSPLALSGTTAFKWRGSNDGSNFQDLAVSSVTYSGTGTQLWDFGEYPYRYLRIDFDGPATGGLNLNAIFNGRD